MLLPNIIKTDINGFDFIARLYSELKEGSKDLTVDFSQCKEFDGNMSAALGALFDKLTSEGFTIYLTTPTEKKVRRTLSRNHFLKAWKVNTEVAEKEYYIEYKSFATGNTEDFKIYIDSQLIHKQKFPQHTEMVGTYIVENIYEIYANAIMHGQSDHVNCCGEYDEVNKILHMTIVDCGVTIPYNVNSYMNNKGKPLLNSCEAIKWAFEEGNTTKNNTGGLGLAMLRDFIFHNEGSLDIVSGDGLITIKNKNIESHVLQGSFPGTIVNMNFNFNDMKNYFMKSEININDLL